MLPLVAALALVARALPAAAICGDQILNPGEECETGPNGDAACPRACIPPGLTDECTCTSPAASPGRYVLIAETSARLSSGSEVLTGGVGVTRAGGSLTMGKASSIAAGQEVVADRVHMHDGAAVGRLFANAELRKGITVVEEGPYRFHVPLQLIPGLPPPPTVTPGPSPFSAEAGQFNSLPPGQWGDVVVFRGVTLLLRGTDIGKGSGTYQLRSLTVQSEGRVMADNPVDVRIADHLLIAARGTIGPTPGKPVLAGDVRLTVIGSLVHIGHSSSIRAYLRGASTTGAARIGKKVSIVGQVIAGKVKIGGGGHLQAEGACGDGLLDPLETCDASAPGGTTACGTTPCAPLGQPGQCTCHCDAVDDCDDANPCTTDACRPDGICTNTPVAGPCP